LFVLQHQHGTTLGVCHTMGCQTTTGADEYAFQKPSDQQFSIFNPQQRWQRLV
jgi:hypothetical protein